MISIIVLSNERQTFNSSSTGVTLHKPNCVRWTDIAQEGLKCVISELALRRFQEGDPVWAE